MVISLIACRVHAHSSVPPSAGASRRPGRPGSRSPRAPPRRPRGPGRSTSSYAGSAGSSTASRPRGRVPVGEHVDPAVAADVQRGAARRRPPARRAASGDSSRPSDRSASHRSLRGAVPADAPTDEPAAVHRHGDAVVVGRVQAGAEHLDVGRRVGADPVQPDPPVELLLAGGHQLRREPAHVVVGLAARQPGDGRVAGPVDRAVHRRAGGDVHDVQHRLLVAARGELVGEQVALLGRAARRPASSLPVGSMRDRVDEHPLGAVRVDGEQHRVLLARPCGA